MLRVVHELSLSKEERQRIEHRRALGQAWEAKSVPYFPPVSSNEHLSIAEQRTLYYLQNGMLFWPPLFYLSSFLVLQGSHRVTTWIDRGLWNKLWMTILRRQKSVLSPQQKRVNERMEMGACLIVVNEFFWLGCTNDYLKSCQWMALRDLSYMESPMKRSVCAGIIKGFDELVSEKRLVENRDLENSRISSAKEFMRLNELLRTCEQNGQRLMKQRQQKKRLWWPDNSTARKGPTLVVKDREENQSRKTKVDEWVKTWVPSKELSLGDRFWSIVFGGVHRDASVQERERWHK